MGRNNVNGGAPRARAAGGAGAGIRRGRFPWRWVRRATQLVCLGLFLWLFRETESDGSGSLAHAAALVFQVDPLVAASAVLAGKRIVATLWPALVTVALTLSLGRFFCGWLCPLGTLLDLARRALPRRLRGGARSRPRLRAAKYFVLLVVLVSAGLGLQLVGLVDPFSILVRGMTVAVDPWLNHAVTAPFTWLYRNAPETISNVSEPVYAFLKAGFLPFQQNAFVWAWVSFAILAAVFALELVERRFWCRNLCPTGALFALLSRFAPLRRLPGRACGRCTTDSGCADRCRMGAFDDGGVLVREECNLCMDCVDECQVGLARFGFARRRAPVAAPTPAGAGGADPSRRLMLASVAGGVALPVLARVAGGGVPAGLIRPPGARVEREFLELCVRCAECMKVCTTNALQPALFETGLGGMFAPRLIAEIGYCEYNCTLCGQVCPTGAIARLPVAVKQGVVIGKAVFDKDLCLPFAKAESCITCEEHCPLPRKAILFQEVEVADGKGGRVLMKQPFTALDLCTGCGICVTKCPLEGKRGVRIVREDCVPPEVRAEYERLERENPPPAEGASSSSGSGYP